MAKKKWKKRKIRNKLYKFICKKCGKTSKTFIEQRSVCIKCKAKERELKTSRLAPLNNKQQLTVKGKKVWPIDL